MDTRKQELLLVNFGAVHLAKVQEVHLAGIVPLDSDVRSWSELAGPQMRCKELLQLYWQLLECPHQVQCPTQTRWVSLSICACAVGAAIVPATS